MTGDGYTPRVVSFSLRHGINRPETSALLFTPPRPPGINATIRATPWDYSWMSVCWSPELGLFCAVQNNVSNNNVMTSPDGITWTGRNAGGSARFNAVAWSPALRRFVAFDCYYNYYVYTSADGISWTAASVNTAGLYTTTICWSPERGIFVAIPGSNNTTALTSNNATTWTARTFPAQNSWQSVCWSPELGLFCAVGQSGTTNRVMTSPDGITWTLRPAAADLSWRGVCWSPRRRLFVAVASSGTGSRVMTSPDGMAWTLRSTPADNSWRSVCWSQEQRMFLAVAESGTGNRTMTSADGITWMLSPTPADNNWQSVCWSPELNLFAAVANTGTGNRAFSAFNVPSIFGANHIIGTERAAYINERRLTVNAEQSATHIANWRVIDGVATCYAASRHSILYPKRHRLFARDVAGGVTHDLGVAEENPAAPGTFTIAAVPLPDGVYEVEARSTDVLWLDARSRTVSTFRLRSGEEPTPELPAVVNLQAGLTSDWWRTLAWSVAGEPGDGQFSLGIWFGDEPPVDISGQPAAALPRDRGLEHYQHYFRQTAPRWVAVAAFVGDHRGQPAAMFLEWETARPAPPERQWAESRQHRQLEE